VHDRAFASSDISAVSVLCTIETRNRAHLEELLARLHGHGVRTYQTTVRPFGE
jgi:threonine dehydratase